MTTNEQQNPNETEPQQKPKPLRGFALLPPEKMSEIARQEGQTAHRNGTAHRWTSETARLAGQTGGSSTARDREYMREIGRRGGRGKLGYRNNRPEPCEPKEEPSDE